MIPGLPEYTIRAVQPGDDDFLRALFVSHRGEEFQSLPLPAAQLQGLLDQQFRMRQAQYFANYPGAEFGVVIVDDVPVGALTVADGVAMQLVEIALMPEFRGRGLGTRLMQGVIERSVAAKKDLALSVQRLNPALRLYERLGFEVIADDGMYLTMRLASHRDDAVAT